MKYSLLAVSSFVVLFFAVGVRTAETQENQPDAVSPLMRMKLEKSKSILEGLALEDYESIERNATALKVLSLESGWNVFQTEEYAMQSREFRRAADLIADAAREKDISRAAMGYVGLTVRCVECHSYMRKHRIELMNLQSE